MFIRIKKGGIKEAVIGRRLGQGLLCLILVGLMGSGEAAPTVNEVTGVARVSGKFRFSQRLCPFKGYP